MAQQQEPVRNAGNPDRRAPRFTEGLINFAEIERLTGLSKQNLQDRKLLEPLLRGYKTDELVNINTRVGNSIVLRGDFRLSFQSTAEGVKLVMDGVKKEPNLSRPFYGHHFSEDDKKNLLSESGHMGRTVELWNQNENRYIESFISRDKLTNQLVVRRAEDVFIPTEVSGVKLSEDEQNELRQGRPILVTDMISKAGNPFDATLQINAERGSIEYIFQKRDLSTIDKIGGVELTDGQKADLVNGKTIFVQNMERKNGDLYSRYVTPESTTGNLQFTLYNPQVPGEIYIPKNFNGIMLSDEEHKALYKGEHVFIKDMVGQTGEYSKFVKVNLDTGVPMYADDPRDFESKRFEIPQELYGHKFTASERAILQDGKAIQVDVIGYDNKVIKGQFMKVDNNQTKIDVFPYDPTERRSRTQATVQQTASSEHSPVPAPNPAPVPAPNPTSNPAPAQNPAPTASGEKVPPAKPNKKTNAQSQVKTNKSNSSKKKSSPKVG